MYINKEQILILSTDNDFFKALHPDDGVELTMYVDIFKNVISIGILPELKFDVDEIERLHQGLCYYGNNFLLTQLYLRIAEYQRGLIVDKVQAYFSKNFNKLTDVYRGYILQNKIINDKFILTNKLVFTANDIPIMLLNPSISEQIFERYLGIISETDYHYLAYNKNISEWFIYTHKKVQCDGLLFNPSLSEEFIISYCQFPTGPMCWRYHQPGTKDLRYPIAPGNNPRDPSNWNWHFLCQNDGLPDSFFERYIQYVDWGILLSYNEGRSMEFFRKYVNYIDSGVDLWREVIKNRSLSIEFIEEYLHKFTWFDISHSYALTDDFIERYKHLILWDCIRSDHLSESFILKYKDRFNPYRLLQFPNLSEESMEKLLSDASIYNKYTIVDNTGLSPDFFEAHQEHIDWGIMGRNNFSHYIDKTLKGLKLYSFDNEWKKYIKV